MNDFVETYVKVGGAFDASQNSMNDSIAQMNDRISYWDEVLMKREIQLRDEFTRVQTMMSQLSQQQQFLSNFR